MASRTITTTGEELISRSRLRRSMVFQNEDSAINAFIKRESPGNTTVSSTDHDHRIGPGGSLALNWETDGKEAIQDRWTIIAASGTPRISLFETEEVIR
ncbi:MAG: hypothetical protein AAB456_04330 [Patescibacteria group bacterium]